MKGIIITVCEIILRGNRDKISVYAGQATLFVIISVFPFFLLLTNIINPGQISGLIEKIYVPDTVSVLSVTAVTALWAASRGMMSLISGLDNINGDTRGYIKSRLVSVAYTGVLVILVAGTMAGYAVVKVITVFPVLLYFSVLLPIFLLMYKFLPKRKRKIFQNLPGAVFSAGGWVLFSVLYNVYVNSFADYTRLYGGLSSAVLFILWLYVCMNIFLWGAEINGYTAEKSGKVVTS